MKERMILLMVTAIALSGIVSGCSAIGYLGGTIIDNTLTEEKPLDVPTAEQIRDSSVTLLKGETIVVETANGEHCEGVYAGTRVVPVHVESKRLSSVLESGYATLLREGFENSDQSPLMLASRVSRASEGGHERGLPKKEFENSIVAVSADALLLLGDEGPLTVPIYEIKGITASRSKETTMRLVILGAITDFMLLQGALGLLLTSS